MDILQNMVVLSPIHYRKIVGLRNVKKIASVSGPRDEFQPMAYSTRFMAKNDKTWINPWIFIRTWWFFNRYTL